MVFCVVHEMMNSTARICNWDVSLFALDWFFFFFCVNRSKIAFFQLSTQVLSTSMLLASSSSKPCFAPPTRQNAIIIDMRIFHTQPENANIFLLNICSHPNEIRIPFGGSIPLCKSYCHSEF